MYLKSKLIGKLRAEGRLHSIFGGGTSEDADPAGCGFGACKFVDVHPGRFAPQGGAADLKATASAADPQGK